MSKRVLVPSSAVMLVMVVVLWAPVLVAQAPSNAGARLAANAYDPAAPAPRGWTPPRTSWGDPDLQGYWLNFTYPGLYTRCIIGYNGWPRTPANYQGETQIVQIPG